MTDAERKLWRHLRARQVAGHRFRRQAPLGPFIVDFVCLATRLVIELDGGQHSEQIAPDAARTAWLESRGFRVLRFWNHQVLQETDDVLETIWLALLSLSLPRPSAVAGSAAPSPTLPRVGGGG